MGAGFRIDGQEGDGSSILSYWRTVSPRYFEAIGIPVVQGRAFDQHDTSGAEKVAIVTESFARRAWPDGHPVGRRIGWATMETPLTVVGVVGDVRLTPSSAPAPHVYMPFGQVDSWLPHELVVRGDSGTAATIDLVRRVVWELDPSQPVAGIATLDTLADQTLRRRRFQLTILSIAAGLAIALALIGIYGVLSYAAGQMASELGVRMALGATRREVTWHVMRIGLTPVVLGAVAGAAIAWATSGLLRGFLFGMEPFDPATIGAAAVLVTATAAIACLIPARRAALRDPLSVIRGL